MHLCTKSMHRMLAALLCILFALLTSLVIVPQAHALTFPSIASQSQLPTFPTMASQRQSATPSAFSSLASESQIFPFAEQTRIEDDPTPLSNLIIENLNSAAEEASVESKLEAFKDEARAGDFYFAQEGSGRCTITSVAMMVRRAAFLDDKDWQSIGLSMVTADGWTSAGVKNSFSTAGYRIEFIQVSGRDALIKLLEEHPEGIAAYDSSVPHAVLLTDYDAESDTFYCADPAGYYSGSRIPVANSWNGACRGDQSAVISGFTSAWIIEG